MNSKLHILGALLMSRRKWVWVVLAACAFPWLHVDMEAREKKLPRLPRAVLLMGYPPGSLIVTSANDTWNLQEGDDLAVVPSMSADGTLIASGRVIAYNPRVVLIQTYSMIEKKWTEYREIEGGGTLAISLDGSKLAFAVIDLRRPDSPVRLHFIDLKTRAESMSPVIGRYPLTQMSWSPDGRQITYYMNQSLPAEFPKYRPVIQILDIESGHVSTIADGEAPAWSPSGEWIAYFDRSPGSPNPNRVWLVHPDGKDPKLLVTLPGDRLFSGAPVWSPDSSTILLNEIGNESKFTMNIHLLDIATRKMSKRFKDTPPIYAWAESK